MKHVLLFVLFAFINPFRGVAQDLAAYMRGLDESEEKDREFSAKIDSLFIATVALDKDSSAEASMTRQRYASELYAYYQKYPGSVTGEKAALYSFFILSRDNDHEKIKLNFKNNDFSPELWMAVYPVFRRAVMNTHDNGLEKVREELAGLREIESDPKIQAYIEQEMDFKIGEAAPDFQVKDMEGNDIALSALKGKVIFLDFWATWCGPCIQQMPLLHEIYDKYKAKEEFLLIGISIDTDLETMRKFVRQRKMDWMHVFDGNDRDGYMAKLFRARGVPKYILIDKEGQIRYNSDFRDDKELLVNTIEELLK